MTQAVAAHAAAVFVGDFNVGKSLLINALLRANLLYTGREESRTLPTFVVRGDGDRILHAAFTPKEPEPILKTHEQFLSLRWDGRGERDYDAAAALAPEMPFRKLMLVDLPGGSSELRACAALPSMRALPNVLFVVATSVEYWPARHTMELIAAHHELFAGRFVVAANMADLLNPDEIRRIRDKAARRMEAFGITPAPPFFTLSARLECARRIPNDEYRRRIKPEVRDLCDAGFDALRVALYEFEALCDETPAAQNAAHVFNHPAARALMAEQSKDCQ